MELPAKQPNFEVNGLDWQCCLAGSSKTAPRIFIFSIAMGADYSFYATYAPAFLGYNNSVLARVARRVTTRHPRFSDCPPSLVHGCSDLVEHNFGDDCDLSQPIFK